MRADVGETFSLRRRVYKCLGPEIDAHIIIILKCVWADIYYFRLCCRRVLILSHAAINGPWEERSSSLLVRRDWLHAHEKNTGLGFVRCTYCLNYDLCPAEFEGRLLILRARGDFDWNIYIWDSEEVAAASAVAFLAATQMHPRRAALICDSALSACYMSAHGIHTARAIYHNFEINKHM